MSGAKITLAAVAALAAAGAAGRRGSAAEEAKLPFGASPRSRAMRQLLRRYDVRSEPEGPLALDVFAGAGGFGLGAQSVGVRTVGVERNPLAVRTARRAGLQTLEADVGELAGPGVPVDVLIGGPPCQPFSSAGKRRGQYDPRDGFGLFLDVVDAVRPRRLVAENVVAFLEPKHRAYREHIMSELAERYPYSGYWVLNARDFGVPQDRERVFIWASEDRALEEPRPRPGTRVRTVAQALPHLAAAGYDAVVPFQGGAKSRPTATRPSPTITTRRNLYAVVGAGRVWRGRGSIPTGPGKARLLRPDETLVLQGFPEGFDPVGNLEQQQCQIGNAVPPPLAAAVVEALTEGLQPRRLDAEELVESLAAIGATPRLLGPRPQADDALLGVLVDPPYLSGPGIVAVYDAARYRELTGRAARPGRSLDAPVVVDREALSRQGISWRSWVGEHPDKRLAMLRG
jgi:DNA (cytosine-5)-methyltransferase 1